MFYYRTIVFAKSFTRRKHTSVFSLYISAKHCNRLYNTQYVKSCHRTVMIRYEYKAVSSSGKIKMDYYIAL